MIIQSPFEEHRGDAGKALWMVERRFLLEANGNAAIQSSLGAFTDTLGEEGEYAFAWNGRDALRMDPNDSLRGDRGGVSCRTDGLLLKIVEVCK